MVRQTGRRWPTSPPLLGPENGFIPPVLDREGFFDWVQLDAANAF
jgi:hypothetical protein